MSITLFQNRIEVFQAKSNKLKKISRQFSIYRLLFFLGGSVITYFLYSSLPALVPILFFAILVSIFLWIIQHHEVIKTQKKQYDILVQINQDEINRLAYKLDDLDTGNDFLDQKHPYINDLDIFGENSLFQLINRTGTFIGRLKLVSLLKNDDNSIKIPALQEAIEELVPHIGWRQRFETNGKKSEENAHHLPQLEAWLREKDNFTFDHRFIILSYSLPILTILSILTSIEGSIPFIIPILLMGINFLLLFLRRKYVFKLKMNTSSNVDILNSYLKLFKVIEQQTFNTPLLKELKQNLTYNNQSASEIITVFFKRLNSLDMSNNPVWAFVGNGILLWDLRQSIQLYHWKQKYAKHVFMWLDTLAQMDTLNSLAGFNYSHKSWVLPTLNENVYGIQATDVGHPLLSFRQRINNPILLNGKGSIHVITGSNMSGKSTYLRTIGINLVLAQLGLRVCATTFVFSPMQIFSSMRTHDSLKQNTSAFYAELLRLKDLIELVKNKGKIIFLLDEILKGTNSKDRYEGAKALIHQLSKLNAIGLISTHDLELSKLSQGEEKVKNFSFNSEIKGSEIIFDYQLTNGVCSSFNASQLMRNIGIDID